MRSARRRVNGRTFGDEQVKRVTLRAIDLCGMPAGWAVVH